MEAVTPKTSTPKPGEAAAAAVHSQQASPETEAYIKSTCEQLRGWLGEEAIDNESMVANGEIVGSEEHVSSASVTASDRLNDQRGRSRTKMPAYAAICTSDRLENGDLGTLSDTAKHATAANSSNGQPQSNDNATNEYKLETDTAIQTNQSEKKSSYDNGARTPSGSVPFGKTTPNLTPYTPENESTKVHVPKEAPNLTNSTPTEAKSYDCSSSTDTALRDRLLSTSALFGPRIDNWLQKTSDGPTVFQLTSESLQDHSCSHDICTITGKWLDQVIQPETIINPELSDEQESSWRQLNMTSGLQILRERQLRKDENVVISKGEDIPSGDSAGLNQEESKDVSWPSTDCLIRPAVESDAATIGEIIDLHHQLDYPVQFPVFIENSETVALQQLQTCLDQQWPFVVATTPDDELLDRKNWPTHADKAYKQFLKYKAETPAPAKDILGVAFVRGFGQSMLGSSQPAVTAGSICVLVHPDHRRKMIGTALLDRMLQSVAPYHRSMIDFQWECTAPNGVYEHPAANNKRQAVKTYVEFTTATDAEEPSWRCKMLEKFGFERTVRWKNVSRSAKRTQGHGWLDLHVWEMKVQDPTEII